MLRFLFDEQRRTADGSLAEAFQHIDQFILRVRKQAAQDSNSAQLNRLTKLEIWALGLRSSLDELEQSCYAASRYKAYIVSDEYSEMEDHERLAYSRYVYFDKNAFIRIFSTLDKLGTFLNTALDVRTERVKAHYSYFTVLRVMRQRREHGEFASRLNAVKEAHKEPMARLRNRRNTEIHYMNSEMQDDLIQRQRMYGQDTKLENVVEQSKDLEQGFAMVLETIALTFQYACGIARK